MQDICRAFLRSIFLSFIQHFKNYLLLLFLLTACMVTMTILVRLNTAPVLLFYSGIFFAVLLLLLNGYIFYVQAAQCRKNKAPLAAPEPTGTENNISADAVFLAQISHDLRTPLTTISGIVEIFDADQTLLDERQKKLVKALGSSAESLKALADKIHVFLKKTN